MNRINIIISIIHGIAIVIAEVVIQLDDRLFGNRLCVHQRGADGIRMKRILIKLIDGLN